MDINLLEEKNKQLNGELHADQKFDQQKKEINIDQSKAADIHKNAQKNDILLDHQEVPVEELATAELGKEEKALIMGKNKTDISLMGTGMEIGTLNADHSESTMRGTVKTALSNYIDIRKKVLEGKEDEKLSAEERLELGGAYEELERSVDAYVAAHSDQAKYGKGKSRLK